MAAIAWPAALLVAATVVGRAGRSRPDERGRSRSSPTGPPAARRKASAAIEEVFAQQHPGIEIINAVIAGGAGSNANAVLATRMTGGDPPDAFQIHGGAELIDNWVKHRLHAVAGRLLRGRGPQRQVPAGHHRPRELRGRPVLRARGRASQRRALDQQRDLRRQRRDGAHDWDEFFAAADTLKAAGITPLALGDKDGWTDVNLFEQILLSQLGADDYRGIWAGTVPWTDARVTDALTTFGKVLDYVNDDHSTLTWDQAARQARRRHGGIQRHGRLGQGLLHGQGLDARTWSSAGRRCPGTDGTFTVVTDTFAHAARAARTRTTRIAWLDTLASVEGAGRVQPQEGLDPGARRCGPLQVRRVLAGGARRTSATRRAGAEPGQRPGHRPGVPDAVHRRHQRVRDLAATWPARRRRSTRPASARAPARADVSSPSVPTAGRVTDRSCVPHPIRA